MLFNSEEKNLMVGAFTAGGLSAIMNGYFGYKLAGGTNIANTPTDPAYWLYANLSGIGVWVPNLSQIIPWFAVPSLLWFLGKKKRSSKLRLMGIGGLVYGFSEFVSATAFKLTAVGTGNLQPYRVIGVVR